MKTRLNLLLFAAFLALNACTGVLKQDGNSVTVNVIAAIAEKIKEVLDI